MRKPHRRNHSRTDLNPNPTPMFLLMALCECLPLRKRGLSMLNDKSIGNAVHIVARIFLG